jgi:phage repressor protein C with HTH and peptisase S24 domain
VRECGVVAIGRAPSIERVDARQPTVGAIEELAGRGRALLVPLGVAAGAGRELWDEECDTCIELPAEVGSGRYVALPVTGDSMSPAMHDGDTVLVKLGAPAVRGAVVVARHPEHGYVVKRVGRIDVDRLELLSLNPEFAPMHIPCDARLVLGQVVLRWCAHSAR